MRRLALSIALLVAGLSAPRAARAFPELVKHGYVHCSACHASPTGGGALTAYGRELSRELLSRWSYDGEQRFAYALDTPESLALGGDFRWIQTYRDTPRVREGHLIWMQGDLEAGWIGARWSANASIGFRAGAGPAIAGADDERYSPISRRHWLGARPGGPESPWAFRAGRFLPAFGIGMPSHVAYVRRNLRINDQGQESYNLEALWQGDGGAVFATAVLGRPDDLTLGREKGLALRGLLVLGERAEIGLGYLRGEAPGGASRDVFGPFTIIGLSPELAYLGELDFQWSQPAGGAGGFATTQKLDWEFTRGLHVSALLQLRRLDFGDVATHGFGPGLGLQFFPRPHFDFELTWMSERSGGRDSPEQIGGLMGHFYF